MLFSLATQIKIIYFIGYLRWHLCLIDSLAADSNFLRRQMRGVWLLDQPSIIILISLSHPTRTDYSYSFFFQEQ